MSDYLAIINFYYDTTYISKKTMNDQTGKIKIPGVEIGYPTSWPGGVLGIFICLLIAFGVFMFTNADEGTQQRMIDFWNANAVEPAVPVVPTETVMELEDFQGLLNTRDSTIERLNQEINTLKEFISNSNGREDQSIRDDLVLSAEMSVASSREIISTKQPSAPSEAEVIQRMAQSEPHSAIIGNFLGDRTFIRRNYYLKSFGRILADNPSGIANEYNVNEIQSALNELVRFGVLNYDSTNSSGVYGLVQGPNLELFKSYMK